MEAKAVPTLAHLVGERMARTMQYRFKYVEFRRWHQMYFSRLGEEEQRRVVGRAEGALFMANLRQLEEGKASFKARWRPLLHALDHVPRGDPAHRLLLRVLRQRTFDDAAPMLNVKAALMCAAAEHRLVALQAVCSVKPELLQCLTTLYYAAYKGNMRAVAWMLERAEEAGAPHRPSKLRGLFGWACKKGDEEVALWVLNRCGRDALMTYTRQSEIGHWRRMYDIPFEFPEERTWSVLYQVISKNTVNFFFNLCR